LVGTISGAAFKGLVAIIERPTTIPSVLASTIPRTSVFFINYVLLQSSVGLASELIQFGRIFIIAFGFKFLAKTPRSLKSWKLPPTVDFASAWPPQTIIFVIAIVFSVLTPRK